jgi:hypothetical protein
MDNFNPRAPTATESHQVFNTQVLASFMIPLLLSILLMQILLELPCLQLAPASTPTHYRQEEHRCLRIIRIRTLIKTKIICILGKCMAKYLIQIMSSKAPMHIYPLPLADSLTGASKVVTLIHTTSREIHTALYHTVLHPSRMTLLSNSTIQRSINRKYKARRSATFPLPLLS